MSLVCSCTLFLCHFSNIFFILFYCYSLNRL